jgi:spermidine synthase
VARGYVAARVEAVAPEHSAEPNRALAGPAAQASGPPFSLTLVLFALSGATGLVDQLCFSKYLVYIVGSTAYAVSAVLAAFMTGLAIGAHLGGRASSRIRRPLIAYGWLEIAVAVTVALTPLGFRALTPLYANLARAFPDSLAALSALRWLVALALVVLPTMAMGATLPFLSRSIEARGDAAPAARLRERRLGWLYAMNTLGGASGALLAAYTILPLLGIDKTVLASAALSAGIGGAALLAGRGASAQATPQPSTARGAERGPSVELVAPADGPLLYLLAFASGCLVFSGEVVFTHLLALIIGNSAYAFGLILSVFLSCLFLGASQAPRLRVRFGDRALPASLTITALALALTLPIWDKLPVLFNDTGEAIQSFAARELVRGVAAFLALCVPTTCMGLTFPLLLSRVAPYPDVGRWVGRLTAVNTVGAVLGSLATGYLLLPWLGSQRALLAFAFAFAGAGLAALRWAPAGDRRWLWAGSLLVAAGAVAMPRWDVGRLTSGTNVYFEGHEGDENVLMIREDVHGGVTTVTEKQGVLTLYTNGKFQGNTGWELHAQRFFAHYPAIFVENFDELLVIGLGTGTTLGTFAGYPFRRIDMVEISPSILDAARTYFGAANRGALDDPRVSVHHADGRNFLLVEKRKYDLISMELSSIWFAGAASLYSKEYYELVRARLEPGGVFQQWVQLHHIRRRDFATIVNTLRRVFPHVILFYGGGQGILVASPEPLRISEARLGRLQLQPELRSTIPFGRPLIDLARDVLVLGRGLDRFLETVAREAGEPVEALISTDSNLYLEYATPRGNVLPWTSRDALVSELKAHRDWSEVDALLVP